METSVNLASPRNESPNTAPIEILEAGQRKETTMQHFIFAILNIHVTLRTQKKIFDFNGKIWPQPLTTVEFFNAHVLPDGPDIRSVSQYERAEGKFRCMRWRQRPEAYA